MSPRVCRYLAASVAAVTLRFCIGMGAVAWGNAVAFGATYPVASFERLRGVIVRDIEEDTLGGLWLATDSGLWHDGRAGFEPVTAWGAEQAYCLYYDRHGVLWVGNEQGLFGIDIRTRRLLDQPLLPGKCVLSVYRDPAGQLWAGERFGLYRLTLDRTDPTAQPVKHMDGTQVLALDTDPDGTLWAGSQNALVEVGPQTIRRHLEVEIGSGHIRGLLCTDDGAVWVGVRGPGGLYRLHDHDVQRFGAADGLFCDQVNQIVAYDDELWIATEDGVFRYDGNAFEHLGAAQGLENTDIHCLHVDREQQVWIGSYGNGVYRLSSPHIRIFGVQTVERAWPHPVITNLHHDANGNLIVGTIRGGMCLTPNDEAIHALGPARNVMSQFVSSTGTVYFGGSPGVWRGDTGDLVSDVRDAVAIGESRDGRLLVGTPFGLFVTTELGSRQYERLPADTGRRIRLVWRSQEDQLWIGTTCGLVTGEPGDWQTVLPQGDIQALAEDSAGSLLVGQQDGLYRLDLTEDPPGAERIAAGDVRAIAVGRDNTIWVAGDGGLRRLTPVGTEHLTVADGLPSRDVRALALLGADTLWAGTTQGLVRIDTANWHPCAAPPLIQLDQFVAGGRAWREPVGALELPYSAHDLLVSTYCPGWRSAVGVRYEYCLQGYQQSWSPASFNAVHQYLDLPPGEYVLRARCVNAHGLRSANEVRIPFHVQPPFWRTTWFIAAATLSVVGVFVLLVALVAKRYQLQRVRRRSERAIRESEAKFRTLADTVPAAIFIQQDEQLRYLNPAAERLTGYAHAQLVGRSFAALIHPDGRPRAMRWLDEQQARWEVKTTTQNDEVRWLDVSTAPVDFEHRPALLIAALDITHRKQAEVYAQRRQARVSRVSRLSLAGELASGLAHEINQPLSAILCYARGWTRRINAGVIDRTQLLDVANRIATQAERAGAILRRLRSLVRKPGEPRAIVDINPIIRAALDFAEGELETHHVRTTVRLRQLPPVEVADTAQIEQVLMNLIQNAIESMDAVPSRKRTLVVESGLNENRLVTVSIGDCGKGVPAEIVDRIFENFFTTKTEHMGLGLSICRSVVEAHGGRIWVSSNAQGGCTFRFALPPASTRADETITSLDARGQPAPAGSPVSQRGCGAQEQ